jgi:hypothetical protein
MPPCRLTWKQQTAPFPVHFVPLLFILQAVADRLGLQRQPLGGSGGSSYHGGDAVPLEVLQEPLTVQLLAGPGKTAVTLTLPVVIVVPASGQAAADTFWELQLGQYDVLRHYNDAFSDQYLLQDDETGDAVPLQVLAPKPLNPGQGIVTGSSSFSLEYSTYTEVLELILARQAVLARRAAAAAGGDEAAQDAAAAAAVQQASGVLGAYDDVSELLEGSSDALRSLPAGLAACAWDDVAGRALPTGSTECAVCLRDMEDVPVVQLRCRHTYCEECVQQVCKMSAARRQAAACPLCRGPVA